MKWSFSEPNLGDAVRVKLGKIYHYGIYVSENQIIQFGLAPNCIQNVKQEDIAVCLSDVNTFLQDGFLETGKPERKDGKPRSQKEVVEYAKSQLGRKGYHILHNNCEHFVYECIFGIKKSLQTQSIRDFITGLPIADVYTFKIPSEYEILSVYPQKRQEEIESVSNQKVKAEKYFAWKLLEYALMRTFGYKIGNLTFTKNSYGKWLLNECYISLSHSHEMVAVALSKKPIGVDIELIKATKPNAIERVLTRRELKVLKNIEEQEKDKYLLTTWSKKESAYKRDGESKFLPSKIDTSKIDFYEKIIKEEGKEYVLTVCSELFNSVRHFENINLE